MDEVTDPDSTDGLFSNPGLLSSGCRTVLSVVDNLQYNGHILILKVNSKFREAVVKMSKMIAKTNKNVFLVFLELNNRKTQIKSEMLV